MQKLLTQLNQSQTTMHIQAKALDMHQLAHMNI